MGKKQCPVANEEIENVDSLGSSETVAELGEAYLLGFAVRCDTNKALNYFQQAAEAGSAKGMYGMGIMYSQGYSVEVDAKQAIAWWEKAAEAGGVDAMVALANTYALDYSELDKVTGERIVFIGASRLRREEDLDKAAEWYKKALATGDEKARQAMGKFENLLGHRAGDAGDREKSFTHYTKAAEYGNAHAMDRLAMYYLDKEDYFENPECEEKHTYWLEQAAKHGSKYAKELLAGRAS